MDNWTADEIEAAIDAAGRRNIANWDGAFSDYDKSHIRPYLLVLALEWLCKDEANRG